MLRFKKGRHRFSLKFKLLLLLSSILASLLVSEIALRIMNIAPPQPFTYVGEHKNRERINFIPDASIGWKMSPLHTFERVTDGLPVQDHSNEHGFRINPKNVSKKIDKRLVVAGDSFAWGAGVPYSQTFGARVGAALGGWEVYNLAMPGFGIDQVWLSIKEYGIELKPTLIIVGIFPEDFDRSRVAYRRREGFNKPSFKVEKGLLVPRTAEDKPNLIV